MTQRTHTGTVYLVGAGPGDPELLTLRATRLLRRADVVLHDALLDPRVLDRIPRRARRIDVGKRCGMHRITQSEINRLLIESVRTATVVVRLKGGDPFVFGRGGEEASALAAAGVPFEVVPGVTAAIGACAYAGIPLTHRGIASTVTLLAGYSHAPEETEGGLDGTVVVYMGLSRLREIVHRLIAAGRSPDTPAAVIERGTYPSQRTVSAPLHELADRVEAEGLDAPALIVVGDVVQLRDRLSWFERRPLSGIRVLVPRSRPQPSRIAGDLEALGAEVLEFPRLHRLPSQSPAGLRRALDSLPDYRWIVLTSTAAVTGFWKEWLERGHDARGLGGVRFACFGTATGVALRRRGIRADVALSTFQPSAAVEAILASGNDARGRVLFPGAPGAGSTIADALDAAGFRVRHVEAYRIASDASDASAVRRRLDEGGFGVVAFSSSGTVRRFVEALGPDTGRAAAIAMGAETARVALSLGLSVHVIPGEQSIEALVSGVVDCAAALAERRSALQPVHSDS